MFSGAPNPAHPENPDAAPNTLVAPVDMGLPAALPVVNEQAVRFPTSLGLALGCSIAPSSRFAREYYFRSAESRVGTVCAMTCRSRWLPSLLENTNKIYSI